MIRVFEILTREDEHRGWCADETYYRLSCEGAESEDAAVDHIVGCTYAALAHREHPPRAVKFEVRRTEATK
jgi:hypothetical protein